VASEDITVRPDDEDEGAMVTLTIPCVPEYVGTARLTILGVGSRMGFSYDQIEDIRLAVGEACTNAIDRAARRNNGDGSSNGAAGGGGYASITIRSYVGPSQLTVEVEDTGGGPGGPDDAEAPAPDVGGINPQELGALLMEILVDEVSVDASPRGGTLVRLVKYTAGA
jgi:serine/threonine-protein kinase RsbW